MSEKSVSREVESAREPAWEKNRKKTSAVKALKSKPADDAGSRVAQRERSVGEGQPNLGSNRNNPDRVVTNRVLLKLTEYQTLTLHRIRPNVITRMWTAIQKPEAASLGKLRNRLPQNDMCKASLDLLKQAGVQRPYKAVVERLKRSSQIAGRSRA